MSLLQLHEISKIFGGLIAINELSFSVEQGSVVGLIGPNGAGKTTVFNCITGNYKPEHGRITFGGQDITGKRPHNIVEMGIARTFQSIRLFGKLPALENVLAGRHCRLKSGFLSSMLHTPWQRREEKAAVERCMEELEFVGLADHYAEAASSLSYGNQRLLEIARALASDPRLLILDEPAGGMNDQETVALVDTIAAIRDRGITVLLIEHDMRLVMQICEHLVVLENVGNLVCPVDFDLGENLSIMILSVPEGDDKPIKYPGIFQHAGAQLLNKVDVAPAFDFDMDRYTKTLDDLNPQAPRFAVSARKGEGMDAWCDWRIGQIEQARA